jgi:hypothetical protein
MNSFPAKAPGEPGVRDQCACGTWLNCRDWTQIRMDKTAELIRMARHLASSTPEFHSIKGAGKGDHATAAYMRELRKLAHDTFGSDYSEKKISGTTNFAVDFWLPDEMTIVEIALTLKNSASEFHKDIFKALLALDSGAHVRRLVFISKPGAIKRHSEPASMAITKWLKEKHGIEMTIFELK